MFYVASNLKHDGKWYRRGDTINLYDTAAAPLLASGAIQTDEISTAQKIAPVEVEQEVRVEPTVGGQPAETGEPSIDTSATAERTEATDITPKVDEEDISATL